MHKELEVIINDIADRFDVSQHEAEGLVGDYLCTVNGYDMLVRDIEEVQLKEE